MCRYGTHDVVRAEGHAGDCGVEAEDDQAALEHSADLAHWLAPQGSEPDDNWCANNKQ
jgi:hypothetical protein